MDLFRVSSTLMKGLFPDAITPASVVIRPVQTDDVDLILDMHNRLSTNSLYMRYHSPRMPTREEIERMCRLDGTNGRVVVAAIPGSKPRIVGMAYYVVTDQDTAETALLVEDLYQGQGIGRRLMQRLTQLAVDQGICFFDALTLSSNDRMIRLLHQTGHLVRNRLDHGTREMRVELCPISG